MTAKIDPAESMALRERARQILRDRSFDGTLDAFERGDLDLERLLEELHIYHAELYLQQLALHESQRANERALARFTRLYHELPIPTLLISWEGFIKDANTAAHRLLRIDRRLFSHLAAEGQSTELEKMLFEARSTGRADRSEVHLRALGDGNLIADLRLLRLPQANDDEPELVCNLIDQTEQVAARDDLITANRRLRIQEQRYHVVADFAPDWAYWMGEDGRFRYVSPACGRISGYPAAAFIKDPDLFTRIIHPEDRDLYLTHLHGDQTQIGHVPLRFRIYARTGELRWIEHLCMRVTDSNDRPLGHRGSNLDVTEKVALERALSMAYEVMDASSTIAFHWAPEPGWPVTYVSTNVSRWGFPIERFLARELTYLDLVHPLDRDHLVNAFDAFLEAQCDVFQHTYRVLWADGSAHWVDEETRCVYDRDGRLAYFHGIVSDVSARERAQRALRRQSDLQGLAAEIASRFVNAESQHTHEVLNAVLERIGGFFGVDRCYLLRFGENTDSLSMSHEWCAEGIRPVIGDCRDVQLSTLPWWSAQLKRRQSFQITDLQALPPEAIAERTEFERQSICSLLSIPMISQGRVIGTLGFDTVKAPACWTDEETQILEVITEVIGGALVRIAFEDELLASVNRYRQVTALMSDVAYSCLKDPQTGFQIDWITDSIEALTGYAIPEIQAMHCWGKLVAEDDLAIFNRSVIGLTPGATADCELRLRHRNGTVRWVRATTQCLPDDTDSVSRRILGGLVDVTEAKAQTAEIKRLALVVEQSPSIIVITDTTGTIEYVNGRFCEVTGYCADEVLGQPVEILRAETANQDEEAGLWSAIERGETSQGEFENRKKSGEPYWEYARITPLRDAAGHTTGYVKLAEDVSDRKLLSQRLDYLAQYDPLTGLPNRLLMRERIEQALTDPARSTAGVILLSIDVDDLRSVNDSIGHRAGDQLLCAVAERWQPLLREDDVLARFSGDNFVVLDIGTARPPTDEVGIQPRRIAEATDLAERFKASLQEPIILDGQAVVVSCSIGIALYPEDASTAEELISRADAALHVAKADGRGLYRFFTSALNDGLQEQFRLEQALRRAIECGELLLHYQPRVDIQTGRILGLEALVRWNHPELGMVAPNRFIPIAESSGLILKIGPMVIRLACEQIAAWQRAGVPLVPVALNLSANELYQDGLVEQIREIAAGFCIPHRLLDLEVTESAAMRSIDHAISVMRDLRDSGFRLAIDDFGTGYASLSYLNRLPVQTLKIDRSFLAEIGSGHPDQAQAETIVKAVIGLGKNLGLGAIAEGVETDTQRRFLIAHGCREAQGYLFSRPRPAEDIEALLRCGTIAIEESSGG